MKSIDEKFDFECAEGFEKIYAGLSGGADSCALLLALAQASKKGLFELEAVHFEHGLRGDESKADAEWCKEFCEIIEVPFRQIDLKMEPESKNLEATARELRLEAWAGLLNRKTAAVAVGQHADDRIENIFLRLMRGSNATGLTSMRRKQKVSGVTFIRPMLALRRTEIEEFLLESGVENWCTDHTNLENIYRRNFIRNKVLPMLYKEFPNSDKAFIKSIAALESDADFLEKHSETVFSEIQYGVEKIKHLPVEYIEDLHPSIQARVLRLWLTRIIGSDTIPTADFLKRFRWAMEDYNTDNGQKILIPIRKGISLAIEKDIISLNPIKDDRTLYHTVEWDYLYQNSIEWENAVISCERVSAVDDQDLKNQDHHVVFFAGRELPEKLVIRKRIDGDRMVPFSQFHEVKIKKLLQNTDLMSDEKKDIPIMATPEGEIIWIPGVRRANFANISDLSVDIVKFKYEPDKLNRNDATKLNPMVADVLINKLIKQEQLMANYYDLVQKELPEFNNIWTFLHKEEQEHIEVLKKLEPSFKSGEIYITSDIVNLKTLQYSLDFLEIKINEMTAKKHTPLELLELALEFELCSMEGKVFDSLASENLQVLGQLNWIQQGTERHATVLRQVIEQYNKFHKTMIGKVTGLFNPPEPIDPEVD